MTFNVSGLNSPMKIHREAQWIKNQVPAIHCLPGTDFKYEETHRLKVTGLQKIVHANGYPKDNRVSYIRQSRL